MYQFSPEFVHVAAALGMALLALGCVLDWWDKRKNRANFIKKARERLGLRPYSDERGWDERGWLELPFDSDGREWGDN